MIDRLRVGETPLQKKNINTGNENISYLESGIGIPVVMLPGWPFSSHMWGNVMPYFDSQQFRMMALDLPGWRNSDLLKERIDYISISRWIKRFLDIQKLDKVNLVGFSFGGAIVLNFANLHPNSVARVVSAAPPVYMKRYVNGKQETIMTFFDRHPRLKEKFFKIIQSGQKWPHKVLWNHDPLDPELQSLFIEEVKFSKFRAVDETLHQIVNTDLRPILPSVTSPVLIVTGEHDFMIEDSKEANRLLPNSSLIVVGGERHTTGYKRPDYFASLIREFTT